MHASIQNISWVHSDDLRKKLQICKDNIPLDDVNLIWFESIYLSDDFLELADMHIIGDINSLICTVYSCYRHQFPISKEDATKVYYSRDALWTFYDKMKKYKNSHLLARISIKELIREYDGDNGFEKWLIESMV